MMTMEQRLAEQQARRAFRQAKRESNKLFNQEMRATLHENWLENQAAYHQDCIKNQLTRQQLTGIWFPGIAASSVYQSYVAHNIDKHQLHIKKLDMELNGKMFGMEEQPTAEIVPVQ